MDEETLFKLLSLVAGNAGHLYATQLDAIASGPFVKREGLGRYALTTKGRAELDRLRRQFGGSAPITIRM
ncbi:hypothetical protein ATCM_12665 [Stenotrophomonas sp. ATCM1_4]|nr:hypothetical protein ATCM_12665 [Stenotrophomonas sp. ATCM1_4]